MGRIKSFRFGLGLIFCLLLANFAAAFGQQTSDKPEALVLEVTRKGQGNIFPLREQLYFRLYGSGRIEYETPSPFDPEASKPNWDFLLKTCYLTKEQTEQVLQHVGKVDVEKLNSFYPPVEKEIDAWMVTTVRFPTSKGSKEVTLQNIRLHDEKTTEVYPPYLLKLLRLIEKLRPKTEEESTYKWDKLY
ncbi:MAG: hypothetical protein JSS77_08535 [Acidobacteria bacterium]|nr:hypothetical protein [Acidobacteriota bacterium]